MRGFFVRGRIPTRATIFDTTPVTHTSPMTRFDDLSTEVILSILQWLDVYDMKSFGMTCRRHKDAAAAFILSTEYGRFLANRAIRHISGVLWAEHSGKILEHYSYDIAPLVLEKLEKDAGEFVFEVANRLADGEQRKENRPIASWSKPEILNFLYPVAIHVTAWELAPFAFEWCVLSEESPKLPLLDLLQVDALPRLVAKMEETQWLEGLAMAKAVTEGYREYVDASLHLYVSAPSLIQSTNQVGLAVALIAALNEFLRSKPLSISEPSRAVEDIQSEYLPWKFLKRIDPRLKDDKWYDLLALHGDSLRKPENLLKKFQFG